MRRVVRPLAVRLLCMLALFGTACGGMVAPPRATSPACSHDTPDPGLCSPLRHPV